MIHEYYDEKSKRMIRFRFPLAKNHQESAESNQEILDVIENPLKKAYELWIKEELKKIRERRNSNTK